MPNLNELLPIEATDVYIFADGEAQDFGYLDLNGLALTHVIDDELVDWVWPEYHDTVYFTYCDADIKLCEMLYGIFRGAPTLDEIAALNEAIWKKEN